MLQADVGDNGNFGRVDDIGGIQGTAHPDLQHHDVAVLFQKILHGDGCDQLKLAWVVFHDIGMDPDLRRNPCEILPRDVLPVHPHAFTEVLNIGRCIEPGPISRMAKNRVQHGTGGAFAVASGNMDEFQLLLRITDGM